ncbi:urease accessory protein UreF [Stutzerimonas stutzeri]|uniref:urease accessory protein UreF n=1 Tax=Pseudomonadaceae TaxID=135621 RepID=UPI000FD28A3E|nr:MULTISPECIES: urease accessory UreF family protein [Pseudomonadaceae]RUI10428.1 urease accessory protein UreF [Pseudomonas aeruginosa]UIP31951.1 urease accessory protein UreF [Stutzerimonas kunmingensis]
MSALASRLAALQQADSFFPAGTLGCSWGLEALLADQWLPAVEPTGLRRSRRVQRHERGDVVAAFIRYQLSHRWNSFDRPFLFAAWQGANDEAELIELDGQIEAMSLAKEMREGSRRNGGSLLRVHAELGTPGAGRLQQCVGDGSLQGHLPIVQGALWRHLGLAWGDAEVASVHGFCTTLASAALRLGLFGHVEAQRVLAEVRGDLLTLLDKPPLDVADAHSFVPITEIAVMRHEHQALRLFFN